LHAAKAKAGLAAPPEKRKPMQPQYEVEACQRQEANPDGSAHPGYVAHHLLASKAALGHAKLTMARLRQCYSSARARGVLDGLCSGMDAALSTLERLDSGHFPGGAK
jgi:hypothetical protein